MINAAKKNRFLNFVFFFRMVKRFPIFVLGEMSSSIAISLPAYVANVLFLKYIISALTEKKPLIEVLIAIGILAIFLIGTDLFISVYSNRWRPILLEQIKRWYYYDIRCTINCFDLYLYDNPSFYDDISFISSNIVDASIASVSFISRIVSNLINIILILGLFYRIGPVVFTILILATGLSIIIDYYSIRLNNTKRFESNKIDRRKRYFFEAFFSRESFMDRKMTPITSLLDKYYKSSINDQRVCNKKYGLKLFILNFSKQCFSSTVLMYFALLMYLLYEVIITHNLNGSDFVASYNAVNVINGAFISLVGIWGEMKNNSFVLDKYSSLTSIIADKNTEGNDELERINTVELKNVSFKYPGTQKNVLSNINLIIHQGDKIAIVGENGSGKTTLVHLLMGLYEPSVGELLVNGKKICDESSRTYREKYAAFFQGMLPLEASISENVALDTEFDTKRVQESLLKTGSYKLLNKKSSDVIGVKFDPNGYILSGGECQKLMLSYCFYSDKSLIIMDEPSSALDPKAEADFNHQLDNLSKGKTVIFVTHRLSTVHMANQIIVLKNGQICDSGNHKELLKKDGPYRDMWLIQEERYGINPI